MTTHSLPRGMVRAPSLAGAHEGYMPGFGNDFETEALPGALPQGQNSPQKVEYGLYANSFRAPPSLPRAARTSGRGATASAPRSSMRGGSARSTCPTGNPRPASRTT